MTGAEHFHLGEAALAEAATAEAGSTAQVALYLKATAHFTAAQAAVGLGAAHIDQTTQHDRKALELGLRGAEQRRPGSD